MPSGSIRREALVLAVTHALALVVPAIPVVYAFGRIPRSGFEHWPARDYSGRVAGVDVAVGDDAAAIAGLSRHLKRVTALREQAHVPAWSGSEVFADSGECSALVEIAFLSGPTERDARIAEAQACYASCAPKARPVDAQHILKLGERWVLTERGGE